MGKTTVFLKAVLRSSLYRSKYYYNNKNIKLPSKNYIDLSLKLISILNKPKCIT